MKIVTFFFARKKYFNKLLKVWVNSLKKAMPGQKYEIIKMKPPENIDHKRDTAFAFLAACRYALKSKETLAICDVDLMFLKDITDIEKHKFDVAITTRHQIKYNTGLWFYKPTHKAKLFVRQWMKNTKMIMENFCKYENFSWQHGGIDQAALYITLKKNKNAKILKLDCREWNATQTEWKKINSNTRIVHIKSGLRLAIFKPDKNPITYENKYLVPLINKWKGFL